MLITSPNMASARKRRNSWFRLRRPYPQELGRGKVLVAGQTSDGSYIQVIYIFSPEDVIFVIHARPLNDAEKRRLRRRVR